MKLKNLLLIAVVAISLVSCKDDKIDIILFSAPNLIFAASGGEKSIEILCKENWNVTIEKDSWIESVTPMSGTGNTTVKVKVKENTTDKARQTGLLFNTQSLLVMQEIGKVDSTMLFGKWETKDGKYKYTFYESNGCHAVIEGIGTFDGTYEVNGNIITITVGAKTVTIVVNNIEKNESMIATMGKTTLNLAKVKIDPTQIIGKWEAANKDYKFTFNENKSCTAEITGRGTFNGTYVVEGDIIIITEGKNNIKVIVDSIVKGESMNVCVHTTKLKLTMVKTV